MQYFSLLRTNVVILDHVTVQIVSLDHVTVQIVSLEGRLVA